MNTKKILRHGFDALTIALSLALILWTVQLTHAQNMSKLQVVISTDKNEWIYPLDVERVIPVESVIGTTIVHITENSVHIEESPCRNKICIAQGRISKNGQWVACLPNKVFVHISGQTQNNDVDRTVY